MITKTKIYSLFWHVIWGICAGCCAIELINDLSELHIAHWIGVVIGAIAGIIYTFAPDSHDDSD